MSITNSTNFRKNLYSYLSAAVDMNDEIIITTKSGNAVLLNEQDFANLKETAYLNSIPGVAESIIDGMNAPKEDAVELDWKNEL